jgi:hypothetical protein
VGLLTTYIFEQLVYCGYRVYCCLSLSVGLYADSGCLSVQRLLASFIIFKEESKFIIRGDERLIVFISEIFYYTILYLATLLPCSIAES